MAADTFLTTPPAIEGLGREMDHARKGRGHDGVMLPILLAAALLLWPAAINGYPLVFSDTGTYLSQAIQHYVGWDRPIFYSLFMLPLHLTLTTWPVIVVQALLAAYTLHLVRRALLPSVSAWWLVPLAGGLAVCSPAAMARLAAHTRSVHRSAGADAGAAGIRPRQPVARRASLATGFSAFMIAAHQSHLLLALLLLPAMVALQWWVRSGAARPGTPRPGTALRRHRTRRHR